MGLDQSCLHESFRHLAGGPLILLKGQSQSRGIDPPFVAQHAQRNPRIDRPRMPEPRFLLDDRL